MTGGTASGHFVDGAHGPIFALLRRPTGEARGGVLVVPPFAEEMNKCRRMVAEVSMGLADAGIATLIPDLYGTGDSGGEFDDCDWEGWRHDLLQVGQWAVDQRQVSFTGILAIRLGAALAAQLAAVDSFPRMDRAVLWQPVFDGKRYLTQFLRLRIAASMLEEDKKESLADLRQRLSAGETLAIAGYDLSGRMAAALDNLAAPATLPGPWTQLHWMEIVRDAEAGMPAASKMLVEKSRAAGQSVNTELVMGEPFWSSTEIVVNETMVAATVAAFSSRP